MKKPHVILAVLVPVLLLVLWTQTRDDQVSFPENFKNESSARAFLKEQVAEGKMTEIEARLRLAEALVQINKRQTKKEYIQKIMDKHYLDESQVKDFLIKQKQEKGKGKYLQKKQSTSDQTKSKGGGISNDISSC